MHNGNTRRSSKACAQCGKSFSFRPSVTAVRVYCSKRCADDARKAVTGEDHPLFKPKVTMACEVCGALRDVKPSLVGRFRACSKRCAATLAKLSYPRTSTIEVAIAEALMRHGVAFRAQEQFQYYVVDFFVPSVGGVIECDGDYWHSTSKQRRIDKSKDAYFANRGIPLVRLSERTIKENADVAVIHALTSLTSHIP